ncbi:MAG TPA: pre-toxin TG domain-containing protein [Polyangiaceae bacterium]|nr:pre-toxin TG domain-containing protein [Polyangiaceae bacterium]
MRRTRRAGATSGTALSRRSTRWRWALLLGLLAALTVLRPSAAQPVLQQVATELGVTVAVPAGLRAAEGLAPFSDLPAQVTGLATFTDGRDEPLDIQVRKGAPHGWKSLPAANSSAAADWTLRFAAALQVPEAYDFKPGRYDPERGALSLQYKVRGPSFARLMQQLPDAHPLWGPTRAAGEPPANAKCLIDALLAGQASASEAELRARVSAASQACSLPEAMVAGYLQQLGAGEFAPSVTTVTYLAFFTRLGTVATLVLAPAERQAAVDEAAALVWSETEVAGDARLPVETSIDWFRLAQLTGIVLGSLLGVLVLGGGLSWLLVRLGLGAPLAAGSALGLLCALSLSGLLRSSFQLEGSLQLGAYLLGSALAFRPLVRRLSRGGGGGPLLRRARSLRSTRGLSTVEYVVVLVLVACVAVGAWRVFGESVRGTLAQGNQQLDGLAQLQLDEDSGHSSPGDPGGDRERAAGAQRGNEARRGEGRGSTSSSPVRGQGSGAGRNAGSPGARSAAGPGAAAANGSGSATDPRGSAAQGAAAGALQGLQPGRPLAPVAGPELPPNAGSVAASGAQEPSVLLRGTDIATDFVPWVSNAKDATTALTGINPVTGEKVGTVGRVMAGVFAVPAAGNLLKYIGKGGKYVLKGGKAAYEAAKTAKLGTRLAGILGRRAEQEIAAEGAERLAKEAEKAAEQAAERAAAGATREATEEAARDAANRAAHEQYLDELRRNMGRPHVEDPKLSKILDEQYREGAKIGSGSTADAVRHEAATGERVGGRLHRQKAEEAVARLEKWLRDNPTARPGDRAAAENVLKDLRNALGGK